MRSLLSPITSALLASGLPVCFEQSLQSRLEHPHPYSESQCFCRPLSAIATSRNQRLPPGSFFAWTFTSTPGLVELPQSCLVASACPLVSHLRLRRVHHHNQHRTSTSACHIRLRLSLHVVHVACSIAVHFTFRCRIRSACHHTACCFRCRAARAFCSTISWSCCLRVVPVHCRCLTTFHMMLCNYNYRTSCGFFVLSFCPSIATGISGAAGSAREFAFDSATTSATVGTNSPHV